MSQKFNETNDKLFICEESQFPWPEFIKSSVRQMAAYLELLHGQKEAANSNQFFPIYVKPHSY